MTPLTHLMKYTILGKFSGFNLKSGSPFHALLYIITKFHPSATELCWKIWWPSSFRHGMRDETCPIWLNLPYSREKPKAEMEYMPTSNCSLHKNDLISLTLATFSLLFVARGHLEWWWLESSFLCSEQFEVGIYSISGHFCFGFSQSFSTLEKLGFDSDPRLHDPL